MTSQEHLCHVVQPILRWGMLLSLTMMVTGLVLGLATGVREVAVLPLERIPSGLLDLDPLAYLTLGILLLIATPLTRVLGALCVFIQERDKKFVLISLVVLSMVTLAIVLGAA